MKTDTLFYQLFQNFPSIFFELIGQPITDTSLQQQIIELIETIVLYKFPNLSHEELEAMLGLSELKQTRVYQEAREEGQLEAKLKIASRLLQRGFSIEELAELLELDIETIRRAV